MALLMSQRKPQDKYVPKNLQADTSLTCLPTAGLATHRQCRPLTADPVMQVRGVDRTTNQSFTDLQLAGQACLPLAYQLS